MAVEQPGCEAYHAKEAYGHCEVILYSDDHQASLYDLSAEHLTKLVNTWADRYTRLAKDERINYIFPFENRGEAVGVTIHHPHGQQYAYSWLPLKVQTELDNAKTYYEEQGESLFAVMNREEAASERLLLENEHFLAYLPYFTDYPFGAFVVSKQPVASIAELDEQGRQDFGEMLRLITGGFDALYDRMFPYMMCIYQAPVNMPEYAGSERYYPLHVKFFPPLRAADKIKWYASSEMGAWAAANTLSVEDTAGQLREAIEAFRGKGLRHA